MLASISTKWVCDGRISLIVTTQVLTLNIGKWTYLATIRALAVALAGLVTERLS